MDPKRLDSLTASVAALKAEVLAKTPGAERLIAEHHQLDAVQHEIDTIDGIMSEDVQKMSDALEQRVAQLSSALNDIRQKLLPTPAPGSVPAAYPRGV